MIEKFTTPLTEEEFIKRAEPVTLPGAKAVVQGLDLKIKKTAGPLIAEQQFFKDVIVYKETGKLPERLQNGKST